MRIVTQVRRCGVGMLAVTLVALSTLQVSAAEVTYGVDLSGVDSNSGNTLTVIGTITAETTTNVIDSSDLVVLREGIESAALLDAFRLVIEMEFEATDTEFRIAPQTDPLGTTIWTSDPTPPAGVPFAAWTITESGVYTIQYVEDASNPNSSADVTAGVQLAGSPDAGYLVGTAIPEPSVAGWLALAAVVTFGRRRTRR